MSGPLDDGPCLSEDDDDLWEDDEPVDAADHMLPSGLSSSVEIDLTPSEGAPMPPVAPPPTLPPLVRELARKADEREQARMADAAKRMARELKRYSSIHRRAASEQIHRAALQCWLGHGASLSAHADAPQLQGALISLLPADLIPAEPSDLSRASLLRLADWLLENLASAMPASATPRRRRGGAARAAGGSAGGAASNAAASARSLEDALASRSASPLQRLLLLLCVLRGLGLRARLVLCLQPPPLRPLAAGKESAAPPGSGPLHVPMWIEAHLPAERSWLAVDPTPPQRGGFLANFAATATAEVHRVVQARCSGRALASRCYFVGFDDTGCADVTVRYAADVSACEAARTSPDWWGSTLAACTAAARAAAAGATTTTAGTSAPGPSDGGAAAAEAAEVARRLSSQPLPSSLGAYKKHAKFILERDLGRYETIHPAGTPPAGMCKGYKVYPRSAVAKLATAERWFRDGRVVDSGARPAKRLKKGGGGGAEEEVVVEEEAGDCSQPGADKTALFGEWQTREYVPPSVTDGVVPRSARGHVEMWTDAHLPRGAAHLKAPRVARVARDLGIDAAPAMVGFDLRDGRWVPRFDGVVVCASNAPLLLEAAGALDEADEDKAARKRRDELLDHWSKVLRALTVRERLEREYGARARTAPTDPQTV